MFRSHTLPILFGLLFGFTTTLRADSLIGINTSGTIYQVNLQTGELTEKANEEVTGVSLGATARRGAQFFYVAAPSGTSENAIFKANTRTAEITHVDLDHDLGDDEVRALFFNDNKLFGIFYNATAGTAGLYKINPKTGVTKLVIDFSSLDLEPLPGAFTKAGDSFYFIGKPESDGTQRQLVKFKQKASSVKVKDILDADGNSVRCDRLQLNEKSGAFVCLASPIATQVDVCKLTLTGRATCPTTLEGIERVAGGHTMATPNNKIYYGLMYQLGDSDSQRLLKFNARGVVKSTLTIPTILVGAHFVGPTIAAANE